MERSACLGQRGGNRPAEAESSEPSKGASDTGSGTKAGGSRADDLTKRPYSEEAVKHYNRGVELHQSGFLNQAIAEYRAAIEADDRMEEAWSNLGNIYAAQKSFTKSSEALQKALSLKPDRPTTLNVYGTVLYARGKVEEAKEKWRQAIKIDPKFASAYHNLGNALEYEHKTGEAIANYVKAMEVNPNMADAYYRIGNIYYKEGQLGQAETLLKKGVALEPDAEWVRDAKKSLTYIQSAFASEPRPRDVKMNVIGPPTASTEERADNSKNSRSEKSRAESPKDKKASTDEATDHPKSDTTDTASDTDSDKPRKKFGLLPVKKSHKKVDMFVQKETTDSAPTESKDKSEVTN